MSFQRLRTAMQCLAEWQTIRCLEAILQTTLLRQHRGQILLLAAERLANVPFLRNTFQQRQCFKLRQWHSERLRR